MTDRDVKAMTENLEAPDIGEVAFNYPVDLTAATVAVVTSASLHHLGQDVFSPTDVG